MPRGRWASGIIKILASVAGIAMGVVVCLGTAASAQYPYHYQFTSSALGLESPSSLERQALGEMDPGKAGWPQSMINLMGPVQMAITPFPPENSHTDGKPQFSSKIYLPHNTELRVSFLYKQDPPEPKMASSVPTYLLFKYSMDYRVMPNLKVGLSGYFYQQQLPDFMQWNNREIRESIMGLGPGVKYDLGRWSFMVRSQLETSTIERREGINSWFRVWYSF